MSRYQAKLVTLITACVVKVNDDTYINEEALNTLRNNALYGASKSFGEEPRAFSPVLTTPEAE
jgi:hypothetical protein